MDVAGLYNCLPRLLDRIPHLGVKAGLGSSIDEQLADQPKAVPRILSRRPLVRPEPTQSPARGRVGARQDRLTSGMMIGAK